MDVIGSIRENLINNFNLTHEYLDTMIELTRQRIGIMSDVKKESIEMRGLSAVLQLAKERRLLIDINDANQLMLLVDIAAWQYNAVDRVSRFDGSSNPAMPADIRYRLNNAFVNTPQIGD